MQHLQGQVDQNDIDYISQRYGMPVLGLPCPTKSGKINPHVSRFLLANGKMADVFHVKPIYYETINGKWRPLSEVSSYHGNTRLDLLSGWEEKMSLSYLRWLLQRMELINGKVSIPYPLIGLKHIREGHEIFLTTSTFYPDPNPETTTTDGISGRDTTNEAWATIRDTAGNWVNDSIDDYACANLIQSGASSGWANFLRSFYFFDTSSIPDGDTISSATFSVYGSSKTDANNCTPDVNVYGTSSTGTTALATSDYQAVTLNGDTAFSNTIAYADWSTVGYNDFALNASGLAVISKTGITRYCCRNAKHDVANLEPARGGNGLQSATKCFFADKTGTANDPKLVVVHSAVATFTPQVSNMLLMGV